MAKENKAEYKLHDFFDDDIWPIQFIQSAKFKHFIDKIPEAVFISDSNGKIIQTNREALILSGYDESVMKTLCIEDFLPSDMRERHIKLRESYFKKPFSRLMGEGGLSLFIYNKEKKKIPMEAALFSIQSDKGALAVNILRDVSDEVEEKKKIEKKAFHDELTGLPNRYYLYEMAEQMIGQAKRNKQILTVLVIDLDKFKPVNDTLGHAVGDHVLKELGQRLGQLKRKNEFIARIGGDEFVYLGFANKGDDHQVLPKRIIDACEVPFIYKDNLIQISASIGMILEGFLDKELKVLLMLADKNLYQAKKKGGGRVEIS